MFKRSGAHHILHALAIALEGPDGGSKSTSAEDDDWLLGVLDTADIIFYFVFLLECVAMIVAFGFMSSEDSYLRSCVVRQHICF
jgi:hypothetical protein